MPLINLVQDRRDALKRNEATARSLFFAFAGVIVSSFAGFGALSMKADSLSRDAAQVALKVSQMKPIVSETEANERQARDLMPRLDTLQSAQQTSDKWARILAHLTKQTPTGIWLTTVRGSCEDPKRPISVSVSGRGFDQRTIADLMLRIQAEPDLDNVTLKYTELRQEGDSKSIEFEVDADLKGTDPAPPAKPKGTQS